jgi:uncharacterized protein
MTQKTLIEFPCYFPIKIMGSNTSIFLEDIRQITLNHFSDFKHDALVYKESKNANYIAITVTIFAQNQDMLDAFYREITKHPDVKMVL